MYKILNFILMVFISISLTQCIKNSSNNLPRKLTDSEKELTTSDNGFGFKLFSEIVKEEKDKNVFISPLSVSMALGMTYNGANGSTKEAMQKTLGFDGLSTQEINASYKSLIELLTDLDPKVIFQIANSIWYRQGLSFEEDFLNLCKEYFDAEVRGLDFGDPNAKDTINLWVDTHTNGKIKEIVKDIYADDVMFLINAIYFKGTWTYQFDKDETRDDSFTLPDGSKEPCKMMELKADSLQYFSNADFQCIDLTYGDGYFSMTIFLPRPGKNIDSLIAEFNEENWDKWMNSFSVQKGVLELPKFKITYGIKLNDVLKALGMGIAFTGYADFSKMSPEGLCISRVRHKTFIEVNEEGTEAAAATSVGMTYEGGGFYMRVDHPFVFVIRENNSQTILFMGKIVEPTWE